AVGGTRVITASFPPVQTAWNDGSGATGGGISQVWAAPGWQTASTVPGVDSSSVVARAEQISGAEFCDRTATGPPCRELPDVSADANPDTNGLTVYYNKGWTVIGGTSSSTPQWAAVLADIAASPTCASAPAGSPGAGRLGFVPPLLYQVASSPSQYAGAFSDVTSGTNDALGVNDGLYPATAGFDMATGLGSPLVTRPGGAPGLAADLCAARAVTAPSVLQVTPGAVPDSAGSTLTVAGTGFSSTCSTVSVGSWVAPPSDVAVDGPAQLTVALPAHATGPVPGATGAGSDAGAYDVTVSCTAGATSAPAPAARLDVYATVGRTADPTVAAVEPTGGPLRGGTNIRVYGSGFSEGGGVTAVTVGGLTASNVRVVSDTLLTARVPAFVAGHTGCLAGDAGATVDVCQTEVRVEARGLTSSVAPLTRELRGAVDNVAPTTPGFAPAPTEFDYLPVPTLTSLHVDGSTPYASEFGGTEVTVHGTGLGVLGLEWMDVGPPGRASSADLALVSDTGTAVTFLLPSTAMTKAPLRLEVAAQTLASPARVLTSDAEPSRPVAVSFAPLPEVARILTGGHHQVGPVSGGTPMVIQGRGFVAQPYVQLADVHGGPSTAEQYHVVIDRADPTGQLSLRTPPAGRGVDQVSVCNISGCSLQNNVRTRFVYFPPGAPAVTSVSPAAGPAGRRVLIRGVHLGYVERVLFGSRPARVLSNPVDSRGLVSETEVVATVPPRGSGTVQVRVVTAESLDTRSPESPPGRGDRFRYEPTP
ncbi:MAG: IPT/TIG domain-containing protein, partial [Acidimicrobiales bacterium]